MIVHISASSLDRIVAPSCIEDVYLIEFSEKIKIIFAKPQFGNPVCRIQVIICTSCFVCLFVCLADEQVHKVDPLCFYACSNLFTPL